MEFMSSPFQPGQVPGAAPGTPAGSRRAPGLPTPPKGWPVGSYPTYAEAQRAVDYLSDQQFPVQQVTIVGVDLMQVERVTGLLTGLVAGVFFGLIPSAVPYAMARGTRDFSSTMQLVAGRYDVLCDPQNAEKARDILARLAI